MGEKRPKRFGEINLVERSIIREIIYEREQKEQTFATIAENLNASCSYPRRARNWNWILVRRVYMANKKPAGGRLNVINS